MLVHVYALCPQVMNVWICMHVCKRVCVSVWVIVCVFVCVCWLKVSLRVAHSILVFGLGVRGSDHHVGHCLLTQHLIHHQLMHILIWRCTGAESANKVLPKDRQQPATVNSKLTTFSTLTMMTITYEWPTMLCSDICPCISNSLFLTLLYVLKICSSVCIVFVWLSSPCSTMQIFVILNYDQ